MTVRIGFGRKLLAVALTALLMAQAMLLLLPGGIALAEGTQRTLRKGCTGEDVKQMQIQLSTLGYMASSQTTGYFGSITFDAVKKFQRASSLKVDGVAGKNTFAALNAAATLTPVETNDTSPTSNNVEGGRYAYKYKSIEITLKKGCHGDYVVDLQTALKQLGYYSGKIDGAFGDMTREAVCAFQRAYKLDVDGIAGETTLGELYSLLDMPEGTLDGIQKVREGLSDRPDLPVELLNWSDVSANVIPRNTDIVIVDAQTGYTFAARRTGGINHADTEPISALDTYTFYTLAGNKWSWERRPVWVIVGNRKLAASINCQPHGYDSISDNDMAGQFCIHFVGSRTHGTNRVDPDHQAAIQKAYELGQAAYAAYVASQPAPTDPQ